MEEARKAYEEGLKLDPNNAQIKESLQSLPPPPSPTPSPAPAPQPYQPKASAPVDPSLSPEQSKEQANTLKEQGNTALNNANYPTVCTKGILSTEKKFRIFVKGIRKKHLTFFRR